MSDRVVIIGASGHAKVIADIVTYSGDIVEGFLDDVKSGVVNGIPILGKLTDIERYKDICTFVIGIGDNQIRKLISEKYDVHWYNAIHPTAVIGSDVNIGYGTVVMAGALINSSTVIGKHCIINTGAVVEHDNRLSNYVHISPHSTLCGSVHIGEGTHIGAGAVIRNNISICANCLIGAGAAVVKDITETGIYIGVPARKVIK